jgi:hypothetical protein
VKSHDTLVNEEFARAARSFWHQHGVVHVSINVIEAVAATDNKSDGAAIHGVRSNLVNGLPPGMRPEHVAPFYRHGRRFG